MKNIVIVGLGLIGGSLAAALKGFEDYAVTGVDTDPAVRRFAVDNGICGDVTDDVEEAIGRGDVVFLCMHPAGILDALERYQDRFKGGALVTDVCGVKTAVMKAAGFLPDTVDFIGSHPMAGKERGGIQNASANLFYGAHYIMTPRRESWAEHISLLERMAKHMGFRDITNTSPEHHDAIIAYTSQAMHIMAVSICDDPFMFDCLGYEGGSFRDCTRVAALEPDLWTQLFSLNAPALVATLERFESNLRAYREVIASGDREMLMEMLQNSSDRKRRMNLEHRRGDDLYLRDEKES